jgi:hypothetical protein
MTPLNLMIKPASVYQFAELLTKPYTQYEAYNSRVINENGKIINENGNMDGLEYIAIRLRNMFTELMPGSTQYFLKSLSGTLKLFNEEFAKIGLCKDDIHLVIETHLLNESNGQISYLDYLLEEATQRYITEEMASGSVGGLAAPAASTMQGGIASYDAMLVPKKKKGKKFKKIIEQTQQAAEQTEKPTVYRGIKLDPLFIDDVMNATSPSGNLEPSEIQDPDAKKYFTRLAQRISPKYRVFAVSGQNPPFEIKVSQKKPKNQSDKKTLP